jgi:hypothetical protein
MDILKKEKLYLSKGKLKFLPEEMMLLGGIIDSNGIQMDPEKVDVLAWKTRRTETFHKYLGYRLPCWQMISLIFVYLWVLQW